MILYTLKFIREVQCRKALWDTSSEEYSDRDLRTRSWEEITDIFADKSFSENEKKTLGKDLQLKWKKLRAAFRREEKRLASAKSGLAASRTMPYMYFKQLQFLRNTSQLNQTQENMDETEGDSENDANSSRPRGRSRSPIIRKKTENEEHTNLVEVAKQSVTMSEERGSKQESDSDRLFLLSLLPHLKNIPEYRRLSTRMALIKVIENNQEFPMQASHSTIRNNNEQYRRSQEYSTPRTTNYRHDYAHSAPGTSCSENKMPRYFTSAPQMREIPTEPISEQDSD